MRGVDPKHKSYLRRLFHGADNVDGLQSLICLYIQDFILPTCPSTDSVDLKCVLIRRLGQEIRTAIITLLS